jgi:hypothetical protein
MTVLNNPEQIDLFRLMTLRTMLKLECYGMHRSRSPSAYAMLKKELGLKGTRESVLRQAHDIIEQRLK